MSEPVKNFKGILATLDRANVDTDQIIPKQFLKSIKRTGFGESLFFDWRYDEAGKDNPEFELNAERFKGASILITRNNFGCGSSREHAVWAVDQYGFRAIVAPSQGEGENKIQAFADIFKNNCAKNSIITIELTEAEVEEIFQMVGRYEGLEATVDLEEQRLILHLPEEMAFHFDIDPAVKKNIIHGLDDIGLTLQKETDIEAFELKHNTQIAPSNVS